VVRFVVRAQGGPGAAGDEVKRTTEETMCAATHVEYTRVTRSRGPTATPLSLGAAPVQ
jgi:hypothetical protein